MTAQPVFDIIAQHGEGPIWDNRTGRLYWVDIMKSCFYVADAASGTVDRHDVTQHVGAVALTRSHLILLALRHGFALYDPLRRRLQPLEPAVLNVEDIRFNDGAVDPAGRFFAGTMPYDCKRPVGKLFRLDPDLSWSLSSEPYTICNGIAWSDDHTTMFFVDSFQKTVFAFAYDAVTGDLGKRTAHLRFEDITPDGMTIDRQGGLWIAFWGSGEIRRYDQSGTLTDIVSVPAMHTTSCCFGGADLDVLYISTSRIEMKADELQRQPLAGSMFSIKTSSKGYPENLFRVEQKVSGA